MMKPILTKEQINNIPKLRETMPVKEIAAMYDCAESNIRKFNPNKKSKSKPIKKAIMKVQPVCEDSYINTISRNELAKNRLKIISAGQTITLERGHGRQREIVSGVVVSKGKNLLTIRNESGRNEGVTLADLITMKVAIK